MSQHRTTRSRRGAVPVLLTRLGRGSHRRGTLIAVLLGLALLVIVLALLTIPMLKVPGNATAAKDDLTGAKGALSAGDIVTADKLVASARTHVDAADSGINGFGSDVWGALPVVGTAVDDARDLVSALGDATSVAQLGTKLYPEVAGDDATFFHDGQVDQATLNRVLAGVRQAGDELTSAQKALDDVRGTTPFVGATIAARRDDAASQLTPLVDGYQKYQPLLDRVPAMLGFGHKRHYLVAMLNPAESRYSGGAVLSYAPITMNEGKIEFGKTVQLLDDPRLRVAHAWNKVRGNVFHHRGDNLVANSTFAPSWGVSGEELLRAWQSARGRHDNGVIAVDVVTLAQLFGVTGDVNVPGYGVLNSANLVKTLIGSYDNYYPDPTVQDRLNEAIIPAFKQQLFEGGNYLAKFKALHQAAKGRHFAMYFRDRELQDAMASLGLAGNLSAPAPDYLGVFTQNTNASKVDYYQRRDVVLDVRLAKSGSATHHLNVVVDNATPPYAPPGTDPGVGYFTRWAGVSLGVFMPDGVHVEHTALRGEPQHLPVRNFYHQDFVAPQMLLAPDAKGSFAMTYRVRRAATVDASGTLTYGLAMDPQGTVNPENVRVVVHLPQGYRATSVPAGWSASGSTVTMPAQALTQSQQWQIAASPVG